MSLSELEFLFFFPPFLALYWLLPRRAWVQNALLVAASLFFYATWSVKLLPLFVAGTLVDYAVLRGFARTPAPAEEAPEAERAAALRRRRLLLAAGLCNNLAALVWFKYIGFFANSVNELFGLFGAGPSLPVLRLLLPLGISFYTMSRVGVLIDTYYERIAPVRSLVVWAAFVSFFPQLIAGPIGRGSELFEQYESPRRPDPAAFARGIGELVWGFTLKGFVAAQIGASWVDPVFSQPGVYTRKAHLFALVGYAAQVFGDFAGYSLLALGTARLLGIGLPDNFNYPFLSASPPEFWRRWHMTLNRWLFDYLYGPMVTGDGFMRNRLGLGFLVIFMISGLWHGATWTFVLWGLLHGLWLLAHYRYDIFYKSLCRKDRVWVKRRKSTAYQLAGWALTLGFFVISLVPFRAPSLVGCAAFVQGLVGGGTESLDAPALQPTAAVALVVLYHAVQLPAFARLRGRLAALPAPVRGLGLGLAVVLLLIFSPVGAGTFIYAQF